MLVVCCCLLDSVREQSTASYVFLHSLIIVNHIDKSAVPPPLLILQLFYYLLWECPCFLYKQMKRLLCWSRSATPNSTRTRIMPTESSWINAGTVPLIARRSSPEADAVAPSTPPARESGEDGSTARRCGCPETVRELRERIRVHMAEHGSQAAEGDERWRARIFKEMAAIKTQTQEVKDEVREGNERCRARIFHEMATFKTQTQDMKDELLRALDFQQGPWG